ncbi:hypothetical protein LINPERHAP2_LOCUS33275, partial [Linum perenne]
KISFGQFAAIDLIASTADERQPEPVPVEETTAAQGASEVVHAEAPEALVADVLELLIDRLTTPRLKEPMLKFRPTWLRMVFRGQQPMKLRGQQHMKTFLRCSMAKRTRLYTLRRRTCSKLGRGRSLVCWPRFFGKSLESFGRWRIRSFKSGSVVGSGSSMWVQVCTNSYSLRSPSGTGSLRINPGSSNGQLFTFLII